MIKIETVLLISVAILVALSMCIGCASAATYTVCPSGCNYSSIQAAIEAADPGDTIEVHSGTYYENVDVTKQLILKGVDTGTGKPVVDADDSGSAITLSADGITLEGFTVSYSGSHWRDDAGIKVTSNHNNITGNAAINSYDGIYLTSSSNNTITDNTVTNSEDGISLYYSSNNTITGNTVTNSNVGIYLYSSSNNNIITSNTLRDNSNDGIHLYSSKSNNITGNNVHDNNGDGIYLVSSRSNNIIGTNVNGNNGGGINLYSSRSNNIIGNNVRDNCDDGISLTSSSNSNIITNNIVNNNDYGIFSSSNSNTITNNIVNNNDYYGIYLSYYSNSNIITNNTVNNNNDGFYLSSSSNSNIITNNTVRDNSDEGIHLSSSNNNNIYLNNFINNTDNAYSEDSTNIWNSTEEITYTHNGSTYTNYLGNYWSDYVFAGNDTNNDGIGDTPYSIDGDNDTHPLIEHWENYFAPSEKQPTITSFSPSSPVSDIEGATRTFNITIDQTVNVSWQINGTEVQRNETVTEAAYTNQSAVNGTWTVSAVVSNANGTAIQTWLWHVGKNQPPIVSFSYSPGNPVINQTITLNASDSKDPDGNITNYEWGFGDSGNTTNTTEPITNHTYASAGTFTVTLTVTDDEGATNATSQVITVSEGLVFDTGTGTYPSIAGTHNGTITTNVTIAVSKLYTYPCAGTGGHPEHVIIWNESGVKIAEADWQGYKVDGHNITFDDSFELVADETYDYTIRTGSYPQIIHADSKAVAGGTITCTSFVDTNGNTYTDWIPAIRLGN